MDQGHLFLCWGYQEWVSLLGFQHNQLDNEGRLPIPILRRPQSSQPGNLSTRDDSVFWCIFEISPQMLLVWLWISKNFGKFSNFPLVQKSWFWWISLPTRSYQSNLVSSVPVVQEGDTSLSFTFSVKSPCCGVVSRRADPIFLLEEPSLDMEALLATPMRSPWCHF